MENKEMEIAQHNGVEVVSESMTLDKATKHFQQLKSFIQSQMRKDTDFGTIPGTPKPSLWKPGAEKLLQFSGLGARLESTPNTLQDWKNGFFNFEFRAVVFNRRTGAVVAEALGSCNSMEPKFRYNWVPAYKVPNGTDKNTLETRKDSKGNTLFRIENQEPAGLANTLMKLSQKRALVAATLMATSASFAFGQDLGEDQEPQAQAAKEPVKAPETALESTEALPLITEGQAKMVFALSKQLEDPAQFNAVMKEAFAYTCDGNGQPHIRALHAKDLDKLIKFFASLGIQPRGK